MLNVKIAIQQLSLIVSELLEIFEMFIVVISELLDTLLFACWTFITLFSSVNPLNISKRFSSHGDAVGTNGCAIFTGSSSEIYVGERRKEEEGVRKCYTWVNFTNKFYSYDVANERKGEPRRQLGELRRICIKS